MTSLLFFVSNLSLASLRLCFLLSLQSRVEKGWQIFISPCKDVSVKKSEKTCLTLPFVPLLVSVFRPSATVSRIGLMESCTWCRGHPLNPWLADPPPAGWPPWLADDNVMDGWGIRPLRWLSVLVSLFVCFRGNKVTTFAMFTSLSWPPLSWDVAHSFSLSLACFFLQTPCFLSEQQQEFSVQSMVSWCK